ncbi:FG-GAP-like repeat-containing protein [Solirubrobacter taibaiensis]|nr:FG-GAP-like repeat-containing protein [Solirubrobacter taibaiensis]
MWRWVGMTIGLVGLALPGSAAAAQFEAVGPTVQALGPAGDVNGDGYDDLIAGVPGTYTSRGAAYVLFGGPAARSVQLDALKTGEGFAIRGDVTSGLAGTAVAGAGDVNGDGLDDVLVGAPGGGGAVHVVFGARRPADVQLGGTDSIAYRGATRLGTAVAAAGDVNGDGLGDLVAGAPEHGPSKRGSAFVIHGTRDFTGGTRDVASSGFELQGAGNWDRLGSAVDGAGDVNGDGLADVVVGVPASNSILDPFTYTGEAHLVLGSRTQQRPTVRLFGATAGNSSGGSVAGAGDVNGDGYDDLLIGSPSATGRESIAGIGKAHLVPGSAVPFTTTLDGRGTAPILGQFANGRFGLHLAPAGDVNEDGYDDMLIGSYSAGAAVLYGAAYPPAEDVLDELTPEHGFWIVHKHYGSVLDDVAAVSGAGDFDGDGRPDLAASVPDPWVTGRSTVTVTTTGFLPRLRYPDLAGTAGTPLRAEPTQVRATNGTFTVSPPLPHGLTLDPETGVIAGTPTAPGTTRRRIGLRDATGTTAATITLAIAAAPPSAPAPTPIVAAPIPRPAAVGRVSVKCALSGRRVRCRATETVPGTLKTLRVKLTRSGRTYATATRRTVGSFTLTSRRTLTPGRYRLTITEGRTSSVRSILVRRAR